MSEFVVSHSDSYEETDATLLVTQALQTVSMELGQFSDTARGE